MAIEVYVGRVNESFRVESQFVDGKYSLTAPFNKHDGSQRSLDEICASAAAGLVNLTNGASITILALPFTELSNSDAQAFIAAYETASQQLQPTSQPK